MLMLTDRAVAVLKTVCEGRGLRIEVEGGGCSGPRFQMGLEEAPAAADEVLEFQGVQVFLDPAAWLRLHGVTVDFVEGADGGGFSFDDPMAKTGCSCSSGRCG